MAPQTDSPQLAEKHALYSQAIHADTLAEALRLFDAGRAIAAQIAMPDVTGAIAIEIIRRKFPDQPTQ